MPKLIVKVGENAGREFVLRPTNTLGRAPNCDIQLLDRIASKLHCVVELHGTQWALHDQSLNGTCLNTVRVQQAVLFDGDTLTIGNTQLVFSDPGGPQRPFAVSNIAPSTSLPAVSRHPSQPRFDKVMVGSGMQIDERVKEEFAMLYRFRDIAIAASQAGELGEILAVLGNRMFETSELVRLVLYTISDDEHADALACAVWTRKGTDLPPPSLSAIDEVVSAGETLLIHRGKNSGSGLGVPLLSRGRIFAVLWLDARGYWNLQPRDLDYVVNVVWASTRAIEALLLNDQVALSRGVH